MSDKTEQWESRELGTSEEHVRKSTVDAAAVNEALGLKPISIRMQKGMIDDLKAIAKQHGIGYQPLIRQILARFIAEADSAMTINNHKAIISYSPQTDMLRGEFIGLHGGADFYAKDIDSLRRDGETSLRVYLDMCREKGLPAYRHYSGRFNVRISPQLHAQAVEAAASANISLNEWIGKAIDEAVQA